MKSRPKHIPALADLIAAAWSDNAPDAEFGGMSLAQLQAATKPSTDSREALTSLTAQRRAKMGDRDAADEASRDAIQRVVGAVRCAPDQGPDSPLLTAMGYVTRSARKSGLTRKAAPAPAPTAKAA